MTPMLGVRRLQVTRFLFSRQGPARWSSSRGSGRPREFSPWTNRDLRESFCFFRRYSKMGPLLNRDPDYLIWGASPKWALCFKGMIILIWANFLGVQH